MKTKTFKFISLSVVLCLVVGMLTFAIPTGTVAAASPGQDVTPPGEEIKGLRTQILERRYQMLLRLSERQGNMFEHSEQLVARMEKMIARLQEMGKDTAALEAALAEYQGQVALAQESHAEAIIILNTHAGFDENGKVTDIEKARETVNSAGEALRSSRQTMVAAMRNLRQAVKEWREANPPENRINRP